MARPFLKWAGGKGQLLPVISDNLPDNIHTYIEPFVGSGAVMFDLLERRPSIRRVIINDINTDLITTYSVIKANCEELIRELSILQEHYTNIAPEERQAFFYDRRDEYNERLGNDIRKAALFIFLNRTCFNGLYRVNGKNKFNVPFGKYANPKICDSDNLRAVSSALQIVELRNGDFNELIEDIDENCFVYLDPPYKPISDTSSFNSYASNPFDDSEQIRLRDFCNTINEKGALFMLSNSDPKSVDAENLFFDRIYSEYIIQRVKAKRNINANGNNRGEINELLITNYQNSNALLFGR